MKIFMAFFLGMHPGGIRRASMPAIVDPPDAIASGKRNGKRTGFHTGTGRSAFFQR